MKIDYKIGAVTYCIKTNKPLAVTPEESIEFTFVNPPDGWTIQWYDYTDSKDSKTKKSKPSTGKVFKYTARNPQQYLICIKLVRGDEIREGENILIECVTDNELMKKLAVLGINIAADAVDNIRNIGNKLPSENEPNVVTLKQSPPGSTYDLVLWALIQLGTKEISFEEYKNHIDHKLHSLKKEKNQFFGIQAYSDLKKETEEFLKNECCTLWDCNNITNNITNIINEKGINISEDTVNDFINKNFEFNYNDYFTTYTSKYLSEVANRLPATDCAEVQKERLCTPILLELIWNYWNEEGMLVQSLNAIGIRFQNRMSKGGKDALANLDIDPLRPLGNLIWGYIQDEINRLSVIRRAYEYDHHYGISLVGKAIPVLRSADSRSKFLQAFHNLLNTCTKYFKEFDNNTINADAFPLRNALRDVHLLLAEGAHNQYGDLPWTARGEMLMQQWLLSRPEMREFLKGRDMVPYDEGWMQSVDIMKKLQGWTDVSITHFHNLAVWGEQILLSIRHGNWNSNSIGSQNAANWAIFWRNAIQEYIYAYKSVTGVNLEITTISNRVNDTQPSLLIRNRKVKTKVK